ncbi:hypothetical protein CYANOKiyG1_34250 [Okeania sp. KiyG1]|nr:hypothetical protein CYANOKiyG1_34250 [Okeania sp. KiyG1]
MVITNPISTEKQALELNDTIVPNVDKLFLRNAAQTRSTFDTLYYRRQIEPEKMPMVLQAHVEGSSLRGISRTVNLAYNTVVSLVSSSFSKRANDS